MWLEILFFRFIDHDAPTHVLRAQGDGYAATAIEEYGHVRRTVPTRLPRFIQSRQGFMLYEHEGTTYAVPYTDGRFDLARSDYNYLLRGRSVEEVAAQIPRASRHLEADRSEGKYIPARTPIVDLFEVHGTFALYLVGEYVYAIPPGQGPPCSSALIANIYPEWYHGRTIGEVRRRIDEVEFVRLAERMAGARR